MVLLPWHSSGPYYSDSNGPYYTDTAVVPLLWHSSGPYYPDTAVVPIILTQQWSLLPQYSSGPYYPQLPHSYHFTTCILVLKFVNKRAFSEEIQDSHFPRKRGYFGTHLCEFGEKGVNFDVQFFYRKKGGSFGLKSQSFTAKRGFILGWKVKCFGE